MAAAVPTHLTASVAVDMTELQERIKNLPAGFSPEVALDIIKILALEGTLSHKWKALEDRVRPLFASRAEMMAVFETLKGIAILALPIDQQLAYADTGIPTQKQCEKEGKEFLEEYEERRRKHNYVKSYLRNRVLHLIDLCHPEKKAAISKAAQEAKAAGQKRDKVEAEEDDDAKSTKSNKSAAGDDAAAARSRASSKESAYIDFTEDEDGDDGMGAGEDDDDDDEDYEDGFTRRKGKAKGKGKKKAAPARARSGSVHVDEEAEGRDLAVRRSFGKGMTTLHMGDVFRKQLKPALAQLRARTAQLLPQLEAEITPLEADVAVPKGLYAENVDILSTILSTLTTDGGYNAPVEAKETAISFGGAGAGAGSSSYAASLASKAGGSAAGAGAGAGAGDS